MTTIGRLGGWKLYSASLIAIAIALGDSGDCARAQITHDGTLGAESSVVTPNVIIKGIPSERIDGGAKRGANLFHSFREFNVREGRGAYFFHNADIQNILARVTGSNLSVILGTLGTFSDRGVNSNPNLFLINPNGIIFGSRARLDVRGSFVATSANAIGFSERGFFSASAPDVASELLTVNPSAFFFNQIAARPTITNQAVAGLQVDVGKNLLLLGGDVRLDGGKLIAVGGRVELGGVAEAGTVRLNVDGGNNNLSLSFPDSVARADVSLTNGAEVNVAAGGGGSIALNARNVDILGGSSLRAGIRPLSQAAGAQAGNIELRATGAMTIANSSIYNAAFGAGNGGNLSIHTGQLIVRDGVVATATISEGDAGDLTVNASDSVELTGTLAGGTVPIVIPTVGSINVPIGLFAASLSIEDFIGSTNPFAALLRSGGDAGDLTINTGRLLAQGGATVSASTTSPGQGGTLTVLATDSVELSGTSRPAALGSRRGSVLSLLPDGVIPSGVRNETGGRGPGGDLTITTERLLVRDGAWVTAGTAGSEPGGNLTVNASDSVQLSGISSANGIPSVLVTGTQNAGASKDLTINTRRLIVWDGAVVSAGTSSSGQGGNLTVNAPHGSVELIGTAAMPVSEDAYNALLGNGVSVFRVVAGRPFPSGLITGTAGTANAGNLNIDTGRLVIRDGAQASVSTVGAGNGGILTVRASSVELTGTSADGQFPNALIGSSLLTTAVGEGATGNGGNIIINTGELNVLNGAAVTASSLGLGKAGDIQVQEARSIQLNNGGAITATTESGNGGDIKLQAQDLLLLRRKSNISTTAGTEQAGGNGGNITIDTDNLVALENSDITANAFTGQGGKIQINTQGLFGTEFREIETSFSDITASSTFGLDGTVEINSPDVDTSFGLVALPIDLVDASRLIAQGCSAVGENEFIVTGRGGLPPNPSDTLSSDTVWTDLRPTKLAENRLLSESATQQTLPSAEQLVEAQGWVINNKGEVVLTATAAPVVPHTRWQAPAECHAP